MVNGEHLTEAGLNKIISLKAVLNKGLTEILKGNFHNVVPSELPIIENVSNKPLDPY
jgi:hypothetical protein